MMTNGGQRWMDLGSTLTSACHRNIVAKLKEQTNAANAALWAVKFRKKTNCHRETDKLKCSFLGGPFKCKFFSASIIDGRHPAETPNGERRQNRVQYGRTR